MSGPWDEYQSGPKAPWEEYGGTTEAPKPSGAFRRGITDKVLGVASGALGLTKAIADSAGADNVVSKTLDKGVKGIDSAVSPEAQADRQEQGAIMDEAKGKGVWDQVKAGASAFGVAPVQTTAQGVGSAIPFILGGAGGVPVAAGMGVAAGVGTVKGAIFEDIKKRGTAAGMSDADATAAATKAQEYSGENQDQIALGGALGVADALTGVSRIGGAMLRNAAGKPVAAAAKQGVPRGVLARAGLGAAEEMPLEAVQGGQEVYAANVAANRAGYGVDPMEGVYSNATLEALASAGPGAGLGALNTGGQAAQPVGGVIPNQGQPLPMTAPRPAVPPVQPVAPAGETPLPTIDAIDPNANATAPTAGFDPTTSMLEPVPPAAVPLPTIDPNMGPISQAASLLADTTGVVKAPDAVATAKAAEDAKAKGKSRDGKETAPKPVPPIPVAQTTPKPATQPVAPEAPKGPIAAAATHLGARNAPELIPSTTGEPSNAQAAQTLEIIPQPAQQGPIAEADARADQDVRGAEVAPGPIGTAEPVDGARRAAGGVNVAPQFQEPQGGKSAKSGTGTQAGPGPVAQAGQPAAAPAVAPAAEAGQPATPVAIIEDAAHQAATSPLNDLPQPTEAQAKAGNYKKGHLNWKGLNLTFENPKGSERKGTDPSGKPWSVTMPAHYGYVKRTTGADGDQVDIYMGDAPESDLVFVVDQQDADTGKWDEHKAILGARSMPQAIKLYDSGFSDGRGSKRRRKVTKMSVGEFKAWLKDGDTTQPVSEPQPAPAPETPQPASRTDRPAAETQPSGPAPVQQPAPASETEGQVAAGQRTDAAATADQKPSVPTASTESGQQETAAETGAASTSADGTPYKAKSNTLRVGTMPTNAEPVTIKDGVIFIGKYEALNFDTGEPVKIAPDANPLQIRKALADNKALGAHQKVFGGIAPVSGVKADSQTFVPAPDGSLDYGAITPEMGKTMRRQAGAIRLQEGNALFGLRHIEARHGDQIRAAGFESVEAFVEDTARHIDRVLKPDSTAQLVAVHKTGTDQLMYIELRPAKDEAGDYYTIRTAFPARQDFVDRKGWEVLWEGRAQPSQPAASEQAPFAVPPKTADKAATNPSGQSEAIVSPATTSAKPTGGRTLRSAAYERNPLLTFLANHGLFHDANKPRSQKAEFSPDKQIMVMGYGPVFKKTGLMPDLLVARAVEDGYLPQDGTELQLVDLIRRAIGGEKIAPMYAEGAAETEMQKRVQAIDDLRELDDNEVAGPDPDIFAISNASTEDAMRALGFTDQEIHDATAQGPRAPQEGGQGRGEPDEAKTPAAPGGAQAGPPAPAEPEGPSEGLTAPTRADVLRQQDAADDAQASDQRAQIDREAAAQTLTAQTAPEQRRDTTGDIFGGPSPEEAMAAKARDDEAKAKKKAADDAASGQAGMFDQPEASAPVTPAEQPKPKDRLTDAGEELIRNRRGKLKGLAWDDVSAMNDTLKVAQVIKSNVWPRPDYAKMVEDGAPAWKAASLKAVYDKLSAAPVTRTAPTDADLRAYIETMNQVRETLMAELDRVERDGTGDKLWASLEKANVFGKVFPIPTDARPVFGYPSAFDRVSAQGKENNRRALLIGGNAAVQALQFNYKMTSKVKDLLAEGFPKKQEAWEKSYEVRQSETRDHDVPEGERTGEPQQRFYIYEKGSRWRLAKGVQDGGYATQEQAEAFARTLTAKKRDVLPPSRGLDLADVSRTGPDWRKGQNVTADQVMEHFGFRGVNLGEYVKAKQEIAQAHLNHAFDAFNDLADLLGVPPKAMSLNGTLGVAIGAQGSGKALAHFVPGVNEINITRDSGAGALAHEFGHAMDHYFATQHGRAVSMAKRPYLSAAVDKTQDAGNVRPEVMDAMRTVMKAINTRPMTEAEAKKYMADQRALNERRMDRWVTEFKGNRGADPEALAAVAEKLKRGDVGEVRDDDVESNLAEFMRAAGLKPGNSLAANAFTTAYRLRDLADEARFVASHIPQLETNYSKVSAAMDAKKTGDGYWGTPWEKFARAFETFVMDALNDRQRESLYLSGLVDGKGWQTWADATGKSAPYPSGDERLVMQQAFQKLVDTIQTREDDAGNVALFARGSKRTGGVHIDDARAIVAQVREALPTAPAIHIMESVAQAPADLRKFIKAAGAENDVDAAYHEGEIYIFPANIPSVERLQFVVAHHEIRHHGFGSMLGPRKNQIMFQIHATNANVRAAAAEQGRRGYATSRVLATEEALADMPVEDLVKLNGWDRIVAAVRDWLRGAAMRLRRAGLGRLADAIEPAAWTDNDVAALIARSEGVSRGGAAKYATEGTMFGRADTAASSPEEDSKVAPPHKASWNAPEPSKFDNLIYTLQDKQIDTRRVVQAIRESSQTLADQADVYLQEELFHGRAAKRTQDFVDRELRPMLTAMQLAGVSVAQLDEFLHARHAEEANELIAQRNPAIVDAGSGMTTGTARAYLSKLDPNARQRLEAVAKQVDAIIAGTRDLYVAYGLESSDTVDGWGAMFQNYVPLMREDHDGGMGIGQGFSIKGRESKGRTGSANAKVIDILANIAMQRERAVVRGEKNRVATALVGLAEMNANGDFWSVGPPAAEKVYDPKTDKVVERVDPLFKSRDNVVVAKVLQPDGEVVEKAVVFNEHDERALRMAKSLKNLDTAQLEGLLGTSAKISRYFAAINTQYNPVFGAVNLVRDFQGAIINLSSTPLAGHSKTIAGHTLSALRGIYIDARDERLGKTPTSAWAALWSEFQEEGGQTGFRDLYRTSKDRADAIERELDPTKWMESPLGKFFTAGGRLKVPLTFAQKGATGIFGWLSDYNLSMENAVRLAAYKTALEQGMSKQQAASLGKNLTVNFNRKGQVGQQAGALYAFFNAAVQGTARLGQTLFDMDGSDPSTIRLSRTGKKIVYGGVLLGTMQALLLAAAGFDDEEPPDFVRERSLIIPTGGKTYVTIPMPLGLHILPNLGRIPTEFALGGFKKPVHHVVKMLGLTIDAFNPVGGGASVVQAMAPTAIDPIVALAENRDWTGKPIAKTSFNKATPGHALAKDTASAPAKMLSEAINYLSGGTDHVRGVFSPTPDQIDYLWGQATGGVGREASKVQQTISAAWSGEDLPPYKIPLLGRFYGNSDSQASQSGSFYANLNRINEHEAEVKGLRKEGRGTEASQYIAENPDARLIMAANLAERQVQKLRSHKRDLIAKDAPAEQVKEVERQIADRMRRFNELANGVKASATTTAATGR